MSSETETTSTDLADSPVPPTEPMTAPTAPPRRKPGPKPGSRRPAAASVSEMPDASPRHGQSAGRGNVMAGSNLVPNLAEYPGSLNRTYVYWVGVYPDCPVECIDIAGIGFPKAQEIVRTGPSGETQRIPVIGGLARIDSAMMERLTAALKRTVIRFTHNDKGVRDEPGIGSENVGKDPHIRPRRGHVITIPTPEEVRDRTAQGFAVNRYEKSIHDEPAARHMYCQLCPDQENPARGVIAPQPLEVTGIELPPETN